MARTVEAILKANVSGFNSSVDSATAKMNQLADAAQKAGAKVDASLSKGAAGASKFGSTLSAGGATAATGLDKATEATDRLGKSGSGIQKNSAHLNSLARTAALAGAAVFAGIGVAVKATADFDQAMSHVSATGQDFTANLGGLRKAAIDAGAATAFSATEAANAEEELAKAGVSAADTLGGGLTGALNLAAAGSLGVADAANIAATAMTQFGLKGKDVPHIADLLAAGAGKAQGSVEDLGNALNYVGPVAASMGVSIEQTTGVLAEFASAGLVGEKGGTALRGVLLSLTAPSKVAADKMKELGINLYDAQGNFVGVNGAADALAGGLHGLTEAEKNVALGAIFGNAQITAATVLYKGGSAAVNAWTAKVNESGYAARTAATKMDNLRGDLEQLSGSLQTAFIQSGEAATGGLRGLTKGLVGLVNKFNDVSPATKSAGLAIAAIGGAGLLGVAGLAKIAVSVSEARVAMAALRTETPRLAGALGGIGKAAGVAAGALIALEIAGAAAKAFHGVLTPNLEEATRALTNLQKAGNAADLNQMFTINDTGSFGQVTTDVDSLGSAFLRLKNANTGDKINNFIDNMLNTTETTVTRIKVQFDSLDKSLIQLGSAGHAGQAAAQFRDLSKTLMLQGATADDLIKLFPEYAQSVRDAGTASHFTFSSATELADAMGGKLSPALEKALQSSGQLPKTFGASAAAVGDFAGAINALTQPISLTAEQAGKLSQSLFSEGQAVLSTVGTHSQYAASLDAADKALGKHSLSIDKNTGLLKDNTDKQRQADAALNDIASSGQAYVQSLVAQGASAKTAANATKAVRDQFVSAADAAGLSSKEANKLADSYGLIPSEVTIKFQAFGLSIQAAEVKAYGDRIAALPKESQAKIFAIYNDKGPKAALAELNKLDHTTAKPKVTADASKVKADAREVNSLFGKLGRLTAKPKVKTESDAKRVAGQATSYLRAIKDKHPKVVTEKQLANAEAAVRYLKNIRDKHPKVVSEKDLREAQSFVAYIRNQVKGKTVKVGADVFGSSSVATLNGQINRLHNKTVVIHAKTVKSGNKTASATGRNDRDGGYIDSLAAGGPIRGVGGKREDNIAGIDAATGRQTSNVSVGEFVQPADSVDYYGLAGMQAVQEKRIPRAVLRAFADGGYLGKSGPNLAAGGRPQATFFNEKAYGVPLAALTSILTRIAALNNPLLGIAKAAQAVAVAQKALDVENAKIARPRATLTSATNSLKAAQAKKADDQADQLALRKHVDLLKKRADATKGTTAADKAYKRGQQELTALTRKISGETLRITDLTKKHTAAQTAYNAVAEKSKAAQEKLKAAQDALIAQQQAMADAARQVSDTLRQGADTTSTDPIDILNKRKETAKELLIFNQRLLALRKAGLNDTDIQAIVGRGALDGTELADSILKGGKGLVGALNSAQKELQSAADKVGLTSATGVIRRAGGGWIDGPTGATDKIRLLATRGEYVTEPRSAAANADLLERINASHGRDILRGMAGLGSGSSVHNSTVSRTISIPVTATLGGNDERILSRIQGRFMDALTVAGLVGEG